MRMLCLTHISFRAYREPSVAIVCHYEKSSANNSTLATARSPFLTSNLKRVYLLIIVVFRVAVPFLLLLVSNIVLFVSVRQTSRKSSTLTESSLVRHGHHGKVTPMIFFSSCILLLTISPRYFISLSMICSSLVPLDIFCSSI